MPGELFGTSARVYTTVDKSTWGDGPWRDEPDKVQWIDEATGYDCLAVRGPGGHWCGYVGVPPRHAVHGVHYDRVRVAADAGVEWPSVHGGLTFSDSCHEGPEEASICHVPAPGRPDDVWWLGFDCAHLGDCSPKHDADLRGAGIDSTERPTTYKTLDYVRDEAARLAAQLDRAFPEVGDE